MADSCYFVYALTVTHIQASTSCKPIKTIIDIMQQSKMQERCVFMLGIISWRARSIVAVIIINKPNTIRWPFKYLFILPEVG